MIFMLGGLWLLFFAKVVIFVIIDSHAHYNNSAYKKPFRYLAWDNGYALKEGDRAQLFDELLATDIPYMTKHYLHVQDPIRIAAITKFDRAFSDEPETHPNIIDFMKSS